MLVQHTCHLILLRGVQQIVPLVGKGTASSSSAVEVHRRPPPLTSYLGTALAPTPALAPRYLQVAPNLC